MNFYLCSSFVPFMKSFPHFPFFFFSVLNKSMKDKIICLILVLVLKIENYSLDFTPLVKDLGLEIKK